MSKNMNLKDNLTIILITYNRKRYLRNTLSQILSSKSPIRDFDITIVDNCSDDGTDVLIKGCQKKFNNIKYIRNPINIGGNANICKAIELAYTKNKKYFWIICDDDDYNFKCWNQVEEAIGKNKDMILVSHVNEKEKITKESIINECAFLPSAIYKTNLINSIVVQNSYLNIYHSFPHLAIICYFFNKNYTDFAIVDKKIVEQNWGRDTIGDTKRGTNNLIHYKQKHTDLPVGYVNTYKMLRDEKFRLKCNEYLCLDRSFAASCYYVYCMNKKYHPNLWSFFSCLSFKQKIIFIIMCIFGHPIDRISRFVKVVRLHIIAELFN